MIATQRLIPLARRVAADTATHDELEGLAYRDVLAIKSDRSLTHRRPSGAVVRADVDGRVVPYVMSTENAVGRSADVIEVDGWELADFHKRGQPFLYGHNMELTDGLPLGNMRNVRPGHAAGVRALLGDAQFAPAGLSEMVDKVLGFVRSGVMPGGSVGFDPLEARRPTKADRTRYRGLGPQSVVYAKTALIEFSAVSVAMDPDAMAQTGGGLPGRAASDDRLCLAVAAAVLGAEAARHSTEVLLRHGRHALRDLDVRSAHVAIARILVGEAARKATTRQLERVGRDFVREMVVDDDSGTASESEMADLAFASRVYGVPMETLAEMCN